MTKHLILKQPDGKISLVTLISDDKRAIAQAIGRHVKKFYNSTLGEQIINNIESADKVIQQYSEELKEFDNQPLISQLKFQQSKEELESLVNEYKEVRNSKNKTQIDKAVKEVEAEILLHDKIKENNLNKKAFIQEKTAVHIENAEILIPASLERNIVENLQLPEDRESRDKWRFHEEQKKIIINNK